MKKIVALLLAMLMMLNLSFAMAEDTFEENLAAFLKLLDRPSMSVQEKMKPVCMLLWRLPGMLWAKPC